MPEHASAGPFLLYSTTPEGCQDAVVSYLRARSPGSTGVRLVVLQTPLAEPHEDQVQRLHAQFSGHGMLLETIDPGLQSRDDAARGDVLQTIAQADLILATGGDPEQMTQVLHGTPALAAIRAAHTRGAVIGGGSAGAMVYGAGLLRRPRTSRIPVPLLGWLPDLVVAPHFGAYPIDPWVTAWPGKAILGLRDGAVALIGRHGQEITSLGNTPVDLLHPSAGMTLHHAGSSSGF
jgi:cyanophycinase-like exopeptidase